jgi:hypothetical protein
MKGQHFSWVTDLRVSQRNVYQLMRGGRTRWKIENETFNTLQNQGYNFEQQLRAWRAASLCGVCHADGAGLLRGPGPAAVLRLIPGGLGEAGQQAHGVIEPGVLPSLGATMPPGRERFAFNKRACHIALRKSLQKPGKGMVAPRTDLSTTLVA